MMTQEALLKAFQEELDQMAKLMYAKNNDYSASVDALWNLRLCEVLSHGKITASQGILVRLCDKFARLFNLLLGKDQMVSDESADDTIRDAAVYLILLRILRKSGPTRRLEDIHKATFPVTRDASDLIICHKFDVGPNAVRVAMFCVKCGFLQREHLA